MTNPPPFFRRLLQAGAVWALLLLPIRPSARAQDDLPTVRISFEIAPEADVYRNHVDSESLVRLTELLSDTLAAHMNTRLKPYLGYVRWTSHTRDPAHFPALIVRLEQERSGEIPSIALRFRTDFGHDPSDIPTESDVFELGPVSTFLMPPVSDTDAQLQALFKMLKDHMGSDFRQELGRGFLQHVPLTQAITPDSQQPNGFIIPLRWSALQALGDSTTLRAQFQAVPASGDGPGGAPRPGSVRMKLVGPSEAQLYCTAEALQHAGQNLFPASPNERFTWWRNTISPLFSEPSLKQVQVFMVKYAYNPNPCTADGVVLDPSCQTP